MGGTAISAHDLLNEISRHDGRLVRTADGLKVQAPAPLPDDLMARLRASKAELLRMLDAEAEKTGRVFTHFGAGHPDAQPPESMPAPAPRPAEPWPQDLTQLLRRVSVFFEWSQQDVADFRQGG